MTDATIDHQLHGPAWTDKLRQTGFLILWAAIIGLALFFFASYALRYYLHYDRETFRFFWNFRFGLLLHITGGMVALFTAPWQFWSGYRRYPMRVHRWTGRVFLAGVATGVIGAVYLAFTSELVARGAGAAAAQARWPQAFALLVLAAAWASTAGMAFYAIRKRRIDLHKEWMIRAYVVTFAFVTFRLFTDFGPASHIVPRRDLAITMFWACWVVPLFITELVLQARKIRRLTPAE